jgi:hypothetical protein
MSRYNVLFWLFFLFFFIFFQFSVSRLPEFIAKTRFPGPPKSPDRRTGKGFEPIARPSQRSPCPFAVKKSAFAPFPEIWDHQVDILTGIS